MDEKNQLCVNINSESVSSFISPVHVDKVDHFKIKWRKCTDGRVYVIISKKMLHCSITSQLDLYLHCITIKQSLVPIWVLLASTLTCSFSLSLA